MRGKIIVLLLAGAGLAACSSAPGEPGFAGHPLDCGLGFACIVIARLELQGTVPPMRRGKPPLRGIALTRLDVSHSGSSMEPLSTLNAE